MALFVGPRSLATGCFSQHAESMRAALLAGLLTPGPLQVDTVGFAVTNPPSTMLPA